MPPRVRERPTRVATRPTSTLCGLTLVREHACMFVFRLGGERARTRDGGAEVQEGLGQRARALVLCGGGLLERLRRVRLAQYHEPSVWLHEFARELGVTWRTVEDLGRHELELAPVFEVREWHAGGSTGARSIDQASDPSVGARLDGEQQSESCGLYIPFNDLAQALIEQRSLLRHHLVDLLDQVQAATIHTREVDRRIERVSIGYARSMMVRSL